MEKNENLNKILEVLESFERNIDRMLRLIYKIEI